MEEEVDEEGPEGEGEFAEWVEEVEVEESPGGDRLHVLVCQHSQDGAVVVLRHGGGGGGVGGGGGGTCTQSCGDVRFLAVAMLP